MNNQTTTSHWYRRTQTWPRQMTCGICFILNCHIRVFVFYNYNSVLRNCMKNICLLCCFILLFGLADERYLSWENLFLLLVLREWHVRKSCNKNVDIQINAATILLILSKWTTKQPPLTDIVEHKHDHDKWRWKSKLGTVIKMGRF
jgi:hypothetical protein